MAGPFSYDPGQDPDERILAPDIDNTMDRAPFSYSENVPSNPSPVTGTVLEQRATKWNFGLGEESPGQPSILNSIATGNEKELEDVYKRLGHAREVSIRKQALQRLIDDRKGVYTPEDLINFKVSGELIKSYEQNAPTVQDYFAHRYSEKSTNTMFEWWINQRTPTEEDFQAMDMVQRRLYVKEAIQKFTEDLQKKYDDSGWSIPEGTGLVGGYFQLPRKISANLERFIPLLYDARMRESFFALTGSDLLNQYKRILNRESPDDAIKEAKQIASEIYTKNPSAGIDFLHGLLSFSSADVTTHNLFSLVDWGFAGGSAAGAVKGGFSIARNALAKDIVKATSNRTTDPIRLLEVSGDVNKAAEALAMREISGIVGSTDYSTARNLTVTLQQGTAALEKGGYSYSREQARRITEMVNQGKQRLEDRLFNPGTRIQRLEADSPALKAGSVEADRTFNARYPNLSDFIIDMRVSNIDDFFSNNYFNVYRLGQQARNTTFVGKNETGVQIVSQIAKEPVNMTPANLDLTPEAQRALQNLKTRLAEAPVSEKQHIADLIDDITRTYRQPPSAQTNIYDLTAGNDNVKMIMGDPYLKPFRSAESADYAAKDLFKLKQGDYQVTPGAGGWYVEVRQNIPETAVSVRNQLALDTKNDMPQGWGRLVTSLLPITKDAKQSAAIMESAKLTGYSYKNMQAFVKTYLDPINELRTGGKKNWDDFKTFIEAQRHYQKDGVYGKFSRTLGEFEEDWMKQFNRLPNEAEGKAYFAYVQLSDVDWVYRNMSVYTKKLREGVNQFTVETGGGQLVAPNIPGLKTPANKVSFEGRLIHEFPSGSEKPFSFIVWDKDPNNIVINRVNSPVKGPLGNLQAYRDAVAKGEYKIIQVDKDAVRSLRETGGVKLPKGHIDYVLVKDFKTGEIPFQQLPYRPGGHRLHDYSWYARQADLDFYTGGVNKSIYYRGDLNHTGFVDEKTGREYIRRFNNARQLLDEGNDALLQAYVSKNLPYSVDHFKRFFEPHGGELKTNVPIHLTRNNESVDDAAKLADIFKKQEPNTRFIRATESPHNLYTKGPGTQFTAEREKGLEHIVSANVNGNLQFEVRPTKWVDPMITAHRAAEQIVQAQHLDDLKIKAIERFIAEFSDVLAWDINKLRANPMEALMNAPIKASPMRAEYWTIKEARRTTLEMLGLRTPMQQGIDTLQQKFYENVLGPKIGGWASEHIADWALPYIKDPTLAMRMVAFRLKQGLFNPIAYINQAAQVAAISAIETTAQAPLRAVRSGITSNVIKQLEHWATNDKMIEAFAHKTAPLTGLNKQHFKEMFKGLIESGYNKAGKEQADYAQWLSHDMNGRLFGGKDWDTLFLRKGEETARRTSYAAAYHRWRDMNPNAVFDSAAKTEVLNRADLLNGQMSSVSNTLYQKGIPGVITQFFSAQLRQAELMLEGVGGSVGLVAKPRLNGAETLRLMTVNSLLYGIPIGVGTPFVAGLWPLKQTATQKSLSYGVDPQDHQLINLFINGFAQEALKLATGTQFDTSSLGLGGISLLKDLYDNNKPWYETLSGVSGRTILGVLKSFYPFEEFIMSTGSRPLTREDFADLLANVSSFSSLEKAYYAHSVGIYYGRNEQYLQNISGMTGIISALTGLNPQTISTMSAMLTEKKNIEAFQKKVADRVSVYVRRAVEASNNNDSATSKLYWDRANRELQLGLFTPQQQLQIKSRAMRNEAPLIEKVAKDFWMKIKNEEDFTNYKKFLRRQGRE